MGKKKNEILLSAAAGAAVAFTGTFLYYNVKYKPFKEFAEADFYINRFFYSDQDINQDSMIEGALSGYVQGLDDKYSHYMTKAQSNEATNTQAGMQTSIGITITLTDDNYFSVEDVADDTPAYKAGIKKGDIIISIDGNDIAKTGYYESLDIIKQKNADETVALTVKRGGEMLDISVTTQQVEIKTVDSKVLDDNIGYISISRFNEKTPEQMKQALDSMLDSDVSGIIFDVRNNGGGLVSAVEECLDPLLPEGDIAVAIYKDGKSQTIVKSDAQEIDKPMTVLANENSASGAELFSASLRDFKNVPLVGKTTYGKGVMQDTFKMKDGGSITLTVAKYKTTKSECYHGIGLIPDYEVEEDTNTQEDEQLDKAVEVLKEKIN